jgi:hypothetical protein
LQDVIQYQLDLLRDFAPQVPNDTADVRPHRTGVAVEAGRTP